MITLKQLKDKLHKDFGWENLESDDNKWFVDNLLKDTIQAIEVIRCCESDSEQLLAYTDFLRKELHLNISDTWVESYKQNSK